MVLHLQSVLALICAGVSLCAALLAMMGWMFVSLPRVTRVICSALVLLLLGLAAWPLTVIFLPGPVSQALQIFNIILSTSCALFIMLTQKRSLERFSARLILFWGIIFLGVSTAELVSPYVVGYHENFYAMLVLPFLTLSTVYAMLDFYYLNLRYLFKKRINHLESEIEERIAQEAEHVENVAISLARAVDAKDSYTEGHAERVSQYSVFLGERLGLPSDTLETLRIGALIHDIGKIGIDINVLHKAGPLNDEEFNHIKEHPAIGEQICMSLNSFGQIYHIIRHHHEKLDGSGYPDGLTAEDIEISTRIVTIADIFDALTTDRPYRKSMSIPDSLGILQKEAAQGKLDADLVCEFEIMFREMAAFD